MAVSGAHALLSTSKAILKMRAGAWPSCSRSRAGSRSCSTSRVTRQRS